eukprot:979507-Amorphochlora_amoeboformis.AAC.1
MATIKSRRRDKFKHSGMCLSPKIATFRKKHRIPFSSASRTATYSFCPRSETLSIPHFCMISGSPPVENKDLTGYRPLSQPLVDRSAEGKLAKPFQLFSDNVGGGGGKGTWGKAGDEYKYEDDDAYLGWQGENLSKSCLVVCPKHATPGEFVRISFELFRLKRSIYVKGSERFSVAKSSEIMCVPSDPNYDEQDSGGFYFSSVPEKEIETVKSQS